MPCTKSRETVELRTIMCFLFQILLGVTNFRFLSIVLADAQTDYDDDNEGDGQQTGK